MKYPRNRCSPAKHHVKGYTRKDGTRVGGHPRGKGTKQRTHKRSRTVGRAKDDDTPIGVHAFTVNFKYSNKPKDGESVIVLSNNYVDALDEAWEERMDNRTPISVEAIDPDIGAAIKWMGKRVRSAIKYGKPKIKRAAHLGAKYTVRATMATGSTIKKVGKAGIGGAKELGRLTAFAAQKEIIQSLLKLCYQTDRAKRTAARYALKKRYPEVYAMCDFSREGRGRPRNPPQLETFPKRYVS